MNSPFMGECANPEVPARPAILKKGECSCSPLAPTHAVAGRDRHLSDEVLQAFVAGEVDPARRVAFGAHLEACAACRARHDHVRGIHRLMRAIITPDLDELSWRRMQTRVRAQLEDEAGTAPTTLDLLVGRRWGTAGLAAVVAVALLVWFAPGRSRAPADTELPPSSRWAVRQVFAREAPVDLVLGAGVEVELGARGRLELPANADHDSAPLTLIAGDLRVRDLRPPATGRPIRVEVAPYYVSATHADFVVTRLALGAKIAVQRGEVRVAREGREVQRIGAGTQQILGPPIEGPALAVAGPAPSPLRPAARRASVPSGMNPAPAPDAEQPVLAPVPPADARPDPAAAPLPETDVQIEAPADPVTRRLAEARQAYFEAGDLKRAIQACNEVRTAAEGRSEYWEATDLLCQAHTALAESDLAVARCTELLQSPLPDHRRRTLHQQLAEIHRTQRGDCAEAIKHYNQVLIFGHSTPLDDNTRWLRASCALEIGAITLAERDLAQLEASSTFARPDALKSLRTKISASRRTQVRDGATDTR